MSLKIPGGSLLEFHAFQLVPKGAQVVPTSSGPLATVTGNCLITGLWLVVTTNFTATATTVNVGTAAGAATLVSAGTLNSLTVGQYLASTLATPTTPILAAAGSITWIASAGNTGQVAAYLSYIPLDATAGIS